MAIAPTGSGKTLAAFLFAIDKLVSEKAAGRRDGVSPAKGVRVLYVSPLKALGADVEHNLAVEGMHEGRIESTALVRNALDVLAQQTVAECASAGDEGVAADAWFDVVRRSACYESLTRAAFDSVVRMLVGGYNSADLSEFSPRLSYDPQSGVLRPRANAQRLAVTGSGTIPDRGMFPAMLPEGDGSKGRRRVGELDEEMVHESRVGDIIMLGTNTWRIAEIGRDRVIVEPAPGRSARLPFWHGEAAGRPYDMGVLRGRFLHDLNRVAAGLSDDPLDRMDARLQKAGLDGSARSNLMALVQAQRASTGVIPDGGTLVVEQCPDDSDGWKVVLHSPYGKRVHSPWALAVSLRIRQEHGYDPQAMAVDDGIVLQIPFAEVEPSGVEAFLFDPDEIDAIVCANVPSTALFAARFRECAARALLVSPTSPGKRAPLWQQRLKGGQLLEAVRHDPDFPMMAEAPREERRRGG